MSEEIETLKAWTGKDNATLVFDTDKDGWDHGKFIDVLKTPSHAVIGITNEGDIFGGYVSVHLTETDKWFRDDGQFVFSFFSHGRCDVPQRWVLRKNRPYAGSEVKIYDPTDSWFIYFGSDGGFRFGDCPDWSWVDCPSKSFEGLDDEVPTGRKLAPFTTARLLVVRLE